LKQELEAVGFHLEHLLEYSKIGIIGVSIKKIGP
jgi:hypothetical protein